MHKDYCGGTCGEEEKCSECWIDKAFPCSPSCENMLEDGSPDVEKCKAINCDAYEWDEYEAEDEDEESYKIKSFKLFVPLEKCVDSMLFDSGEVIAIMELDDTYSVCIEVMGEVRVTYKDELYTKASDMPDELLAKFRDLSAYEDNDIYIGNNNWFDIIFKKNGVIDPDDDVADIEGLSEDELKELMYDALMHYRMADKPPKLTSEKCPRCNGPLHTSDVRGYAYVCLECDENFYGIEVKDDGT